MGTGTTTTGTGAAAAVTVTSTSSTVAVGGTATISAVVSDSNNSPVNGVHGYVFSDGRQRRAHDSHDGCDRHCDH